jgi:hypothetical protein
VSVSEVRITFGDLQGLVTHQLIHGVYVHAIHHQPRGKRVS